MDRVAGKLHVKFLVSAFALTVVASVVAVYWPGIYGPFIFDDYANIVDNSYLKLNTLELGTLFDAAMSSESGPLGRPLPMLSFSLNYYFSGNVDDPFQFKLINVFTHAINGLLLLGIFYLGIKRYEVTEVSKHFANNRQILYFATLAALLWALHPVHLTSVLYVVQRMTSLSAMFVLAAILTYLYGRSISVTGYPTKGWTISILGTLFFWVLGLLSKENSALLPLYIVLIEFTLYRSQFPLNLWDNLSQKQKNISLFTIFLVAVLAIICAISVSLPGYAERPFSFGERVLSQPRILLFYLYLILFPRIDAFGIFHDDIVLSSGLMSPWTTLPAIFMVTALLSLAVLLYRKHKPLTFAIMWFFVSHLMESTFYPLEPVHEHRNYLAVIGPVVAILYLTLVAVRFTNKRTIFLLPICFLALYAVITPLRAWHWSDLASLHDFEVRNHPNSARAQASMGSMFAKAGQLDEAKEAFLRASRLRPHEVADLVNVRIILAWQHRSPQKELAQEILSRVKHGLITPLTNQVLDYGVDCASKDCAAIRSDLLTWLPIYIRRSIANSRRTAHYYYLYASVLLSDGKIDDSIAALEKAISTYGRYLHPYFLLTGIYMKTGELEKAEKVLAELELSNQGNTNPRDREIRELSDNIQQLKERIPIPSGK